MSAAGNEAFKIRTGGNYLFQVTSREDQPFRGALIRVQQQNNEIFQFVPVGVEAQDTLACVGSAIGVTHRNNNPKTAIGGLFSTNSTQGDIFIDVTVVDRNDDEGSIFSYTRYQIGVVSPSISPLTPPPTTLKTFRPTQTPSPTTTPYPTFADVCYVCGSEDMDVTQPDNTATLPGQVFSCRQLSVAASDRKIPQQLCPLAQAAATANCACALQTPAPSAAPTTPRPTPLATLAPTSTFYPTANSSRDQDTSCLLCGSNEQVANSNTTLAFDNALYTCGRLYKMLPLVDLLGKTLLVMILWPPLTNFVSARKSSPWSRQLHRQFPQYRPCNQCTLRIVWSVVQKKLSATKTLLFNFLEETIRADCSTMMLSLDDLIQTFVHPSSWTLKRFAHVCKKARPCHPLTPRYSAWQIAQQRLPCHRPSHPHRHTAWHRVQPL